MLADAHACAEGASPTRMLGAARAQSSCTLRARLLCIDPTCAFPLLSCPLLHSSIRKYSRTRCPRQRSRSTRPRYRGRGRSRAPEWPGWSRAHARSHGHGGPAAAAAAAPRGGRWWRLGVRERAVRGGSVASVAWASRVVQQAARGDDLVESGALVPIVPIHTRFVRSVRIAMFGCPESWCDLVR
jgi:hypothetical protein